MIDRASRLTAIAISLLAMTGATADAQKASIYQATLAEADQKTHEVSTEQLRGILADKSALVLDTRTRAEFDAGHIPGAQNLDVPVDARVTAVERMTNGNKGTALVLYCNGPFCQASRRMADQLVAAGFTDVRRYQLGIPVWRALGGPIEIELAGIVRIFSVDRTAVFIDGRSPEEFAKGSISDARNAPADAVAADKLQKLPLPEDDFNRRIVLFGRDGAQARMLADLLGKRPWHNVAYFPGSFASLAASLR